MSGFKSNKVRALLVYLAVEADRLHRRETLAGLLWPEWPDRDALSNLRYSLSNLRQVVGDKAASPPYLLISRDALQFNKAGDGDVDVTTFLAQTESVCDAAGDFGDLAALEDAISQYRGEFLDGFSLKDCASFEEWALLKRQQLAQRLHSTHRHLAEGYAQTKKFGQAEAHLRRIIELEPWDEASHQELMRTLALSGQRSAALAQFESCRQLLSDELGVAPAGETVRLYELIRDGELDISRTPPTIPSIVSAKPPAFVEDESARFETPVFVAREPELSQLNGYLDQALAGQGRVAFVTGEAGSGKTALLQEFCRRCQEIHEDLVVANGNCNAYTGIGDPYLPFREILAMLTGDVEAKWAAGAISSEHARRLWNSAPLTTSAMLEAGPGLVDTFVPQSALLERITSFRQRSDQEMRSADLIERLSSVGRVAGRPEQSDLFEQYTRVLQAMAGQHPLLLILDDLQWADLGSASLLFHLGRRVAGRHIMVVGAYRPEEISSPMDGERHPLEPVVNELQRDFGGAPVVLDQAERRKFVDALLDTEPNRLESSFREMLYRQTRGHPLFTIELLQGMQERGDLLCEDGNWVVGRTLDWQTLPARVEAAIAERMGRLAQPLRTMLRIASVEGEEFTAEVVARVLDADDRNVVRQLSSDLDRRHHLVRAQAIKHLKSRRVSRYRFRNYLFQRYLYDSLDDVERAYIHEDVGTAMEELYGEQASQIESIAPQLAWHFLEAGITEKSVRYSSRAGARAVQLSAFQEGIGHLTAGLRLLSTLPHSAARDRQELKMHLALGIAYQSTESACSPNLKRSYARARELCYQTDETSQLCQVLGQIAVIHYVSAEYHKARELANEMLTLAESLGDPLLVALGNWRLGFISFALGEFIAARSHLAQVIEIYKPDEHHMSLIALDGKDAGLGALSYEACCLWYLGFPEQAQALGQKALALAHELGHPFALADAICFAGCQFAELARDAEALEIHSRELIRLADEEVRGWQGTGTIYHGEALAMLGKVEEGIREMRAGMATERDAGIICYMPVRFCFLAEALAKAGKSTEALETLSQAFALIEETDERFWEPELHSLQADLLLMQGQVAAAETSLLKAVEVARQLSAKSFELRATVSLARLWAKQERKADARQMLTRIYDWFSEGFNTPDLKEASELIEELA
ncbi:MAG: AAA family ATPase [Chloroflexota bacterium]|nr:MAG: AAA family ATPase [Chloroflexota bacterium]